MFWRLLALFTLVPLLELALLLYVGSLVGPGLTFLLVLVTGIVGTFLARREGIRAWFRVQEALAQGRVPGTELVDALLIVVAGAFLVTPGVLTDAFGLTLLIPPSRAAVRDWLRRRFEAQVISQTGVITLDADQVEVTDVQAWPKDDPTSVS
jgi:UPF0716 protein FxsA